MIVVTLLGIVMLARLLQFWNADSGIIVKDEGNVTDANAVQPVKT
jgi:hypothetical protein